MELIKVLITQANIRLGYNTAGVAIVPNPVFWPALTIRIGAFYQLLRFQIIDFQSSDRRAKKPAPPGDSQTLSCLRLISFSLPSHTSFLPRPVPKEGGLQLLDKTSIHKSWAYIILFIHNTKSSLVNAGERLNRRYDR
jgi:hypothetical protein